MPGDCSRSDSMERAALKQSQPCGSWERKERLGTGGFGHVYLYQHLVSSVIHLYISENMNRVCLWFVLTPCMCSQQESGEKIAVKLCRLELNSKNKDRWTREIQIMKKWAVIVCLNRQGVIWTYFTTLCCFLLWQRVWCSLCAGWITWTLFRPEMFQQSWAPLR